MEPNQRRARINAIVSRLIELLEQHSEFKRAHDRIGDRHYLATRTKLGDTLVEFAREVVRATRDRR